MFSINSYHKGVELYNIGEFDKAIECFELSLKSGNHFKTFEFLYRCYASKKEYLKASEYIKQAYNLNPNNDKVSYEYALDISKSNENINEAQRILKEILKRNKTYKPAQILLDSLKNNKI